MKPLHDPEQEEQFLQEIQSKINKRSRGLYYNQKAKNLKRNLTITSAVMILVVILILIFQFLLNRQSQSIPIIPQAIKNSAPVPKQLPIIAYTLQYTIAPSSPLNNQQKLKIESLLKPFKKDNIYIIPSQSFKTILLQLKALPINLKRDKIAGDQRFYQIKYKQ